MRAVKLEPGPGTYIKDSHKTTGFDRKKYSI